MASKRRIEEIACDYCGRLADKVTHYHDGTTIAVCYACEFETNVSQVLDSDEYAFPRIIMAWAGVA